MGCILVQMPPGERKSGMPDSVDMPAPVKITARRLSRNTAASAATCCTDAAALLMRHHLGRLNGAAIGLHEIAAVARADILRLAFHGAIEIVRAFAILIAAPGTFSMAHAFPAAMAGDLGLHRGRSLAQHLTSAILSAIVHRRRNIAIDLFLGHAD